MHRRSIVLLLGFLATIVVAGGGGVRAPWLPSGEARTTQTDAPAGQPRVALVQSRIRVE